MADIVEAPASALRVQRAEAVRAAEELFLRAQEAIARDNQRSAYELRSKRSAYRWGTLRERRSNGRSAGRRPAHSLIGDSCSFISQPLVGRDVLSRQGCAAHPHDRHRPPDQGKRLEAFAPERRALDRRARADQDRQRRPHAVGVGAASRPGTIAAMRCSSAMGSRRCRMSGKAKSSVCPAREAPFAARGLGS